jgi:hypothetical protein
MEWEENGTNEDQIAAVSSEITAFIRDLVKQWVDFRGYEENIAKIIAKHASAPQPHTPE